MSVLIVAFDGLDKQKIEKYSCSSLQQEEFGNIDISTFNNLTTPELWASFITGEDVSFRGMAKKIENPSLESLEQFFEDYWIMRKWAGLRRNILYKKLLGIGKTGYTKTDLTAPPFLDRCAFASYYVPSFNTYPFNEFSELSNLTAQCLGPEAKYTKEAVLKKQRQFFLQQKEELLRLLENHMHKNLMYYFKFTDSLQHYLFTVGVNYAGSEYTIGSLYEEIEELAGKIIESSQHDYILFVSDHGLSKGSHNENAFYSCNHEIGLDTPHITDFHDLILDWCDREEAAGLDI